MTPASRLCAVVPTRDRPERLARCLAALECQNADAFEIVVVDDASRDPDAVQAVVAGAPRARLVRGEGRGPAAARNAGVRATRAPVVCFIDDDCAPVRGWLQALGRRIADGADAVAGPTRNAGRGAAASAAQIVTNHLAQASLDPVTGRMGFAPSSNLACRAEVLRALAFDERYPLAAGEDRDWCARLEASGRALVLEPAAAVDHHQELSAADFWRQQVRYGRGALRFHRTRRTTARLQRPSFYLTLLRRGFAQGPRTGALVVLAQVATAVGIVLEALERSNEACRPT